MAYNLLIPILLFLSNFVKLELFITEINDRTFLQENITVVHTCMLSYSLCNQISLTIGSKSKEQYQEAFCINCNELLRGTAVTSFKTTIPLIIKYKYICAPSYWNEEPIFIQSSKLSIFIIQSRLVNTSSKRLLLGRQKRVMKQHIEYDITVPPPYSRRHCVTTENTVCPSYYHRILTYRYKGGKKGGIVKSPAMQVPFPLTTNVFVSLQNMGQYLFFPDTTDNLYFTKFFNSNSKKFTISLWIYLYSNCKLRFCNIISFFNDTTEGFTSPVILLKANNHFHVQSLLLHSGKDLAFTTSFKAPLRSWFQLIFSCDLHQWSLSLVSENGTTLGKSTKVRFTEKINLNIRECFGVIGGSQIYSGIDAYVSDVYMYPGQLVDHNIIIQSQKKQSFRNLQLANLEGRECCVRLIIELEQYWLIIKNKINEQYRKYTCEQWSIIKNDKIWPTCFPHKRNLPRPHLFSLLLKLTNNGTISSFEDILARHSNISNYMFEKFKFHNKKKGVKLGPLALRYLEESNCLGHTEATYILATIHFYGIGIVKMNATKALELLLSNVLRSSHRLSLLALGNMHKFNLVPSMESLSAVYYKAVADLTTKDIHNLENEDMYNDRIRLTNEAQIREHTDEDEHLFQWIKHQAEAGIPWAKQRLGRIFYWGSQGIQRNVNQAANYLRLAAQGPEAQAENHFDYGLLLVKNSKETKEIEEGKAQLNMAANRDPRALTVLGWLAESRDHDNQAAYEYYLKASNLGDADGIYNVGVFHHTGRLPTLPMNKKAAFRLFTMAAIKNQLNSGTMYSHYQMTGISGFLERNLTMAVSWARHVGEQNPRIGFYLSEGVRAYRKKNIELSMFYYLLAAFTGLELANFNAAVLCEEHEILAKNYLERECVWYHYYLSSQREEHQIHPYSLIKMGDKNWYGCGNSSRDIKAAAALYLRAALMKEPQAYFNLAFMMENGDVDISSMVIGKIIPYDKNVEAMSPGDRKINIIFKLYQRCEDLSEHNTYLPCKLASQRLALVHLWAIMKIRVQVIVAIILTIIIVYKFFKLWVVQSDTNNFTS